MADLEAREEPVSNPPSHPDPYPALLRAGRRAREIARQTNTPLVIYEDGRIVHLDVSRVDPAIDSTGAPPSLNGDGI